MSGDGDLAPDIRRAKALEERAHKWRMAMFSDEEFMNGILEGYRQEQEGRVLTLAELDQALELD
ncbi:MAG: hypothetical protein HY690_06960 [Chloroflexi bacterium]|nr:hypothetical protein [Chloroflexota bacterium]